MSWPIASVRGDGRDQSRTSPCQRLAASLSWNWAKLVRPQGLTKREAAKHVESFGVGFWIRVQFPAPPPSSSQKIAPPSSNSTTVLRVAEAHLIGVHDAQGFPSPNQAKRLKNKTASPDWNRGTSLAECKGSHFGNKSCKIWVPGPRP